MWSVIEINEEIHVVPDNDKRPHKLGIDCECNPVFDKCGAIGHNSFDERELTECLPRS